MADALAEQQAERMQKFLRRWVPGQHHEAAFGDLLEIAKAHAEHGVDMMAETATGRQHHLEILVMVYEATVYCMLPFFKRRPHADDWRAGDVRRAGAAIRTLESEERRLTNTPETAQ
jgi:hypothetical protein